MQHLKSTKENLKPSELIVITNYPENYPFIVQDALQAFCWQNTQTLHPFVV